MYLRKYRIKVPCTHLSGFLILRAFITDRGLNVKMAVTRKLLKYLMVAGLVYIPDSSNTYVSCYKAITFGSHFSKEESTALKNS